LDVWASLAIAVALLASRQALERLGDARGLALRSSLTLSQLLLPVIALTWTVVHDLGSQVALLIVGVHSLLFAHLGWRDADSPYRFVAVGGFAAFVILLLVGPLGIAAAPAYVAPVATAVLVLVQLSGARLDVGTRNLVRLVASLALFSSVGWYALFDQRHSLAFHLILLGLALAAMVAGSLLRLRVILGLGFSVLLIDLGVIVVRLVLTAERTVQMSAIGAAVLLIGAALVGGAIYVQANRERMQALTAAWRARLAAWE
jgi:hypothetical protein